MTVSLPSANGRGMRRVQVFFFLAAVIAINYTLFRPSPVDVLFMLALACTPFVGQALTLNGLCYILLIFTWYGSLMVSSVSLIDDPEVTYQMVKIGYATLIGICACLVSIHWRLVDWERLLRVWIVSASIATTLGVIGFVGGVEEFIWDGRAKGLLDDPNMYGAFLLPALFGCTYLISRNERPKLYFALLLWIFFGLILSFSRVAIGAFFLWNGLYVLILNRHRLLQTIFASLAALVLLIGLVLGGMLFVEGLDDKLADRFTLTKDYDVGHQGRLSRYTQSIDFILDNPLGMGLLEIEKIFPEPIHNIWLGAFLNYGWTAGFALTLLIFFSIVLSILNFRRTGDGICLTIFFSWFAILSCGMLHEAERWRHLWLFTGLVWGLNYRHFAPPRASFPARPAKAAAAVLSPARA